jgi:membrane-bound lytic murein transglycosylase D
MPSAPAPARQNGSARHPPPVHVEGEGEAKVFRQPFVIGREPTCDVCVAGNARVSRRHTEIRYEEGRWWVVDLNSANGTYVDGERVSRAPLDRFAALRLGEHGPRFQLRVETSGSGDLLVGPPPSAAALPPLRVPPPQPPITPPQKPPLADVPRQRSTPPAPPMPAEPAAAPDGEDLTLSRVVRHYLTESSDAPAGERTRFIRQAFVQVQGRQRRRYGVLIGLALFVGVVALGIAGWQSYRAERLRASAEELFMRMREQDLALATQLAAGAEMTPEELEAMSARRRQAARAYEGFVEELGVYRRLSEEERMIYRTARIFNESEFSMPAGFVREVQGYIRAWQRSSRFQTAARHAEEMGYTPIIVRTLRQYGLPPEFYYLAMQESNFNARAVGPETRWGIAKGAWQFIPTTGEAYGLRIGPRAEERVFDPQDDRHDFTRAADAAARYLLEIYTQLAQASGLLVCASYNWGEHRVLRGLENLPPPGPERARAAMAGIPQNPQERSYWRFYTTHSDRMPDETKGYVMNIIAAATIGQNPRFFGIDMDNPLAPYLEAPLESLRLDPVPLDGDDAPPDAVVPVRPLEPAPEDPPTSDARPRLGLDALRERR